MARNDPMTLDLAAYLLGLTIITATALWLIASKLFPPKVP